MLNVPPEAVGIRLCKIVRGELILCERVRFDRGWPAVETTLRRAAVSGRVDLEGDLDTDFFADLLNDDGDMVGNVVLDRRSYRALKTKWMRCRIERF